MKRALILTMAFVRLFNGDIHKISEDGHTKIHFETYDINISDPINKKTRRKSLESMNYDDLTTALKTNKNPIAIRQYTKEYHKRLSLSFACILFVILGIGLGCRTHSRSGRSGGGAVSVAIIVVYWILFVLGNSLAKNPKIPVLLCSWLPAIVLLPLSLFILRRNWN